MKRRTTTLLIFTLIISFSHVTAQSSSAQQKQRSDDVPHVILSGLQAYKDKGPEDAIRVWIKGSPLEGNKEVLTQANNLRQIQDFYGAYTRYEMVAVRTVAPSIRIYYMVLNYEKGPLFARFSAYRSDQDWILSAFDFNTKIDVILPSDIGSITKP